jgi:hypothetical protein
MPFLKRIPFDHETFTLAELVEKRRVVLRYARTCPVGSERNQLRQIALSLAALFKNPEWLRANTREE